MGRQPGERMKYLALVVLVVTGAILWLFNCKWNPHNEN